MSRIVDADFVVLKNYLDTYSLSLLVQNTNYVALIKKTHKRYLSALTLIAEIESQSASTKKLSKKSQATLDYFKESVSDLGFAVFCLANGAHKPGKIMCRSALETLAKGIAASVSLNILKEKSVFSVLKDAKQAPILKSGVPQQYYSRLETVYGQLCEDVHTANNQNMAHISSISVIPVFEATKSAELAEIIVNVASIITSLQAIFYREFYIGMHHSNKPIVRDSLKTDVVQYLTNPL